MGQCYNSIVVDASGDDVWNALRNFHDLSWAPNVVTSVEAVGAAGAHEIGARRILNGVFHETLIELDDSERTLRYTIDDGPGPIAADAVQNYVGTVQVFPITATGKAFVLWTSSYGSDDEAAVGEFCDPIYRALLSDLASHFA